MATISIPSQIRKEMNVSDCVLTVIADLKVKLNTAIEIRDNIEQLCTGSSYHTFLEKLVPVFMKLLEGPPVFMSLAWEHVRLAFGVKSLM